MRAWCVSVVLLSELFAVPAAAETRHHSKVVPSTVTLSQARGLDTMTLAQLLEPALRARVVAHELVAQEMVPGSPFLAIRFFTMPEPLGSDLCQRTVFTVRLDRVGKDHDANWTPEDRVRNDGVDQTAEVTATPGCSTTTLRRFAAVPSPMTAADAAPALRQLLALQRAAAASGDFPVEISCINPEQPSGSCAHPRAFFAGIHLERLSAVTPGEKTSYFELPEGAEDVYRWFITLSPQADGRWSLSLYGRSIPPF